MTNILNFTSFLPIALSFTLWVAFPVWLALRRSQGLIKIEKTNQEGEKEPIGMILELGIFIFAIPFTTFFFFVAMNLVLALFIHDTGVRFQKAVEAALMLIAIALFLYIYAAERKIYMKSLKENEEQNLTGET